MLALLEEVRARLGKPPRPFRAGKRDYHRVPIPEGFPRHDELFQIFEKQELLMREGKVVWGAVVQANGILYQPGRGDRPATVIHADHPEVDVAPATLLEIARSLFELKRADPVDGEERNYAFMLRDEQLRGMGIKAPTRRTRGLPVHSTGTIVFREHLPTRFLVETFFPILTYYTTPAVIVVPHFYWPDALIDHWLDLGQEVKQRFPHAEVISFTPHAADQVIEMAERAGVPEPWYVRINVHYPSRRRDDPTLSLDLERRVDPRLDAFFKHDDLDVVVDQRDLQWVRGAVVDCQRGRGGMAFTFHFK